MVYGFFKGFVTFSAAFPTLLTASWVSFVANQLVKIDNNRYPSCHLFHNLCSSRKNPYGEFNMIRMEGHWKFLGWGGGGVSGVLVVYPTGFYRKMIFILICAGIREVLTT